MFLLRLVDPSQYSVMAGEHNKLTIEPGQEAYTVDQITIHPQYQRLDNDNDIALIRLKNKVTLRTEVNVVCLPPQGSSPSVGTQATVVGWGETISQDVLKIIREIPACANSQIVKVKPYFCAL